MVEPLLVAFLEGDPHAFEQLVALHRRAAVLFALRLTGDLASAEDAVQEAFAWLLLNPGRVRPEMGFKPLLYTLVRRRCMDWFRRFRKWAPLDEANDYAPETVYLEERKRALHAALSNISPADARVIHLLDIEGFSQKEAAEILGKTPGAVKVSHHRAKERLKHQLIKEGYAHDTQ